MKWIAVALVIALPAFSLPRSAYAIVKVGDDKASLELNGNVRLFATPSTGAQFLPKSDRYAVDSRPPAYRTFELHADGRIDSSVHWVESAQLRQTAS